MKNDNEIMLQNLLTALDKKLEKIKKYKNRFYAQLMPYKFNNYINKIEKDLMVDFMQLDLFIREQKEQKKLKTRIKIGL